MLVPHFRKMRSSILIPTLFLLLNIITFSHSIPEQIGEENFSSKRVIDVKGGPDSVIWIVQLSDLHFSVHNPDRALDFKDIVGPTLSLINPSLVLITGDLTDGKSKDLLTMKQNEEEWIEYRNVMEDVVRRSGLDKGAFFDLRGNHDNFGVPLIGGQFDYFSKYSINGQLGRGGNVHSVTIQAGQRKHLFVGLDSTMSVGLRGPTNLFGHPTDQLLTTLDSELSQWDSTSPKKSVTKISFGHFPLSFSASTFSGNNLQDIFLKHSISAYLCGHLHTRFGRNLKRHHQLSDKLSRQKLFQLNVHEISSTSPINCSLEAPPTKEFWEWEMGDWRKSRSMRILAVDSGHVSYLDIDFKSEAKKTTIILPTFPLDSRLMSNSDSRRNYECKGAVDTSSYQTVRALVFSHSPIVSVMARIYDMGPKDPILVLQANMRRQMQNTSRGDFYSAPWNYKAFEDPSPDRYWVQIEAIDIKGRSTLTDLRPFSINGLNAKISWTWWEFLVMGFQWASLYYPILWSSLYIFFSILLVPKVLAIFSKKQYDFKNFIANKSFLNIMAWVLMELNRVALASFGFLGYLLYLVLFPWFIGRVFTDGNDRGYMTYMGWVVNILNDGGGKHEYIGSPDVMVIVVPHLFFVVFPAIFVSAGFAAEKGIYRENIFSLSGKKEDDYDNGSKRSKFFENRGRWIRKVLFICGLAICGKHFLNCRALVKAYEMNPFMHFPVYSLSIPLLLAYVTYKTRSIY